MISNKKELNEYLLADKVANGRKKKKPRTTDYIWRFLIALRNYEYHQNMISHRSKFYHKIMSIVWKIKYIRMSIKCGYDIGINSCGKGLQLSHRGNIIISKNARIGEYCRIHVGVNIGETVRIGNRVYIGPGAKFFGEAKVADDIAVGANAVVNKEFIEKGITIAGVPAVKVGEKGSSRLIYSDKNVK